MFLGREKKLETLKKELAKDGKSFVLVYGKSRVGKSTLIRKALEESGYTYISYRFEDNAIQYFSRLVKSGRKNAMDMGTYWYDDKEKRKNGEFDCALKNI